MASNLGATMPMTRRRLLRTGLAGLALLAMADCARRVAPREAFVDAEYEYRVLDAGERAIVAAIAATMLDGALPANGLVLAVRGFDTAVWGLPPSVRGELKQLFGLLSWPPTRYLTTGVGSSWSDANASEVSAFLTRWRYSNVTLFRSGYDALHQLVMAGWYGNDRSWPRIGYPGPPRVA